VLVLSRRQFDRLVRAGVLMEVAPRLFDLLVIVPAYVRYLQLGKAGSTEMATARLKLVEAQRRALEQRTAERRQELIERAEVERVLSAITVSLTGVLEGMPGRLTGTLAAMIDQPALIHEALTDEVHRTRNNLADAMGELARREAVRAATPAAETNGGAVGGSAPRVATR
jgi:hypothetical protein